MNICIILKIDNTIIIIIIGNIYFYNILRIVRRIILLNIFYIYIYIYIINNIYIYIYNIQSGYFWVW